MLLGNSTAQVYTVLDRTVSSDENRWSFQRILFLFRNLVGFRFLKLIQLKDVALFYHVRNISWLENLNN